MLRPGFRMSPAGLLGAILLCALFGVFAMVRYAPTQPQNLLKSKTRASIIEYLRDHPGATISELCRTNRLPWGTAQHHLYLLEKAGLVKSIFHGRTHVFYRPDLREDVVRPMAVLREARAQQIALMIMQDPGLRQKEICRSLRMTRKVFRRHLNLMVSALLVLETREGKGRTYFPSVALTQKWNELISTGRGEFTAARIYPAPGNGDGTSGSSGAAVRPAASPGDPRSSSNLGGAIAVPPSAIERGTPPHTRK